MKNPFVSAYSTLGVTWLTLLLTLAVWLAAVGSFPRVFHTLEEISGDWLWRLAAATTSDERRIILVDIDETSLRELGAWPWSRQRLAELSDRLASEGVSLQVFDLVLSAPAADDAAFVASLGKNKGIIAQVFALEPNTHVASGHPAAPLPWAACPPSLPNAQGYLANPAAYAGLPTGHITPLIETDGIVRRQPALICHQDRAYPALFIAALGQVIGPAETTLAAGRGPMAPAWRLRGPALGKDGIPLDARSNIRIPWTLAPQAFISISARDILAGRVPADLLKNAWVVVGSTALGLSDRLATPFGGHAAGFVVHAQLLRGAIDDRLPIEPRHGRWFAALAAVLAMLPLVALNRYSRMGHPGRTTVTLVPLAGLGLAGLLWGSKALLLLHANYWLPWVHAAAFVMLFALGLSLAEYARSRIDRERLYCHLASYLPSTVAAALARQNPSDAIDAARTSVTALHADIRNFSAYCEASPPEETTAVLHAFFSLATRCVERHGGAVEAFQGDAVLAIWPQTADAPAEPAVSALAAARAILQESHAILPQNLTATLAPLAVGIGIETGLATVGSFGLARRRTHLAMGRTITAAARLQEMTAELAHPILLGEGAAAQIGTHRLESQGVFLLEGLKIPCHVYACPLRDCA